VECSHELRTPLATLKSGLGLLTDMDGDADARRRVLARMERAVARTERFVQFFLVLAREGREPADIGWVPVRQVVKEVVEEQRLPNAAVVQEGDIEIEECVRVRASREVITVLLHNLVANACQHAPGGRLRVSWLEGPKLRFDDDGPGFPDMRMGGGVGESAARPGYGIRLELSERLCRTQGWVLARGVSATGGARVEVVFVSCESGASRDQRQG